MENVKKLKQSVLQLVRSLRLKPPIDNDGIQQDLKDHLEQAYGLALRVRYWEILEDLFEEVGYRDYLGALQRYRAEHPRQVELLSMSSFLIDYPFAERLFPAALALLKRMRALGPTVILSDGDVVFQPRKVERSGLSRAVDGHVLIYVHKEQALDDVERRYPVYHYVLVDDKPRILAAVKQVWGDRVTTVFPLQGSYAHDPKALATFPPADVTIEGIGDLLDYDLLRLGTAVPRTSHETDHHAPRSRPEPVARQCHAGPAEQRHYATLHCRALRDGPHLQSHDLRPCHQE